MDTSDTSSTDPWRCDFFRVKIGRFLEPVLWMWTNLDVVHFLLAAVPRMYTWVSVTKLECDRNRTFWMLQNGTCKTRRSVFRAQLVGLPCRPVSVDRCGFFFVVIFLLLLDKRVKFRLRTVSGVNFCLNSFTGSYLSGDYRWYSRTCSCVWSKVPFFLRVKFSSNNNLMTRGSFFGGNPNGLAFGLSLRIWWDNSLLTRMCCTQTLQKICMHLIFPLGCLLGNNWL